MSRFHRGARHIKRNARVAADMPKLSQTISRATDLALAHRAGVIEEIDFQAERDKITELRHFATSNIKVLLDRFISHAQGKGFKCHVVSTHEQARDLVITVAKSHNVRTVVRSKSMFGEEVGIREALEGAGIRVTETDLGEYIVQLNHEPPSHITAPAVHLSTGDVGRILYEQAGIGPYSTPEEMALGVRHSMRRVFFDADMGISGANAIVADSGAMLMMSNEGNIRLVTSIPRVLVVLVSVDKLVAEMKDLAPLIRVIPKNATGQRITNYCTVLGRPARGQEVHVVLVDAGRIAAARDPLWGQALRCVRCAACINVCPVFRSMGGHAYGTTYVGPMGIVLTNALKLDPHAPMLADACTLCGACADVCPARIDLPGLILKIRTMNRPGWIERIKQWVAGLVYSGPMVFRLVFGAARWVQRLSSGIYTFFGRLAGWRGRRGVPKLADKRFDQVWEDLNDGDR